MPNIDKKDGRDGSVGQGKAVPIADKYYGMVKVEKWPQDLKEVLHKQMTERLNKKL